MRPRHVRRFRQVLILTAALPLFQFAQCQTGVNRVLQDVANSLPSTIFSAFQSALLAPFFAIVAGG